MWLVLVVDGMRRRSLGTHATTLPTTTCTEPKRTARAPRQGRVSGNILRGGWRGAVMARPPPSHVRSARGVRVQCDRGVRCERLCGVRLPVGMLACVFKGKISR